MKFTQHCFIRDNTPELREHLRKIGLHHIDGCFQNTRSCRKATVDEILIYFSNG